MAEISLHEYCEQIESVIEQGRYAEAVAHGKCILEHYPKHAATYRLLGKAMIEAGQDEYATDMFHRVLSADPEDVLAWAAMSEVHGRRGELDAAVWCLERAFELAIDNRVVEEELRHLYGRRDGVEPQRVQLTRGALARLYLKGDLLSRAVSEVRALLAEHPEQVDLNIALAEALWRDERRLEASEVCQQVLDELPYCLKVNLLLGEIWAGSGREEGQAYLRRAEALDPENLVAQELFGAASPLPEREVWIVPLEYKPPTEEERPAWMAGLEEAPLGAREAALVDVTAALEAQIEIPSWLEEIVGEEVVAPAPSGLVEPSEEQLLEEVVTAPAEKVPEWLADLREEFVEEEEAEVAGEEEALAALGEPEIPEWLVELGAEVAGDQVPALEEAPSPAVEEAPPPAWLEGEGMPSGDEALAWLEGLAAGKEEELQARAEAEGEARMAEIMGRPKPVEPPIEEVVPEEAPPAPVPAEIPDWLRELAPPEAAASAAALPAIEEAAALLAEEAFGWTAFGEPEAPPAAILPVEEIALPGVPEWARLEEVEAPPVIKVPVVEGPPPEEILEPEVVSPTEEIAPAPVIEEIPGVVEMEVLETIEEIAAPPEAPAVGIAAEQAYLKKHPRDYETWLALAQALWQAGERKEALEAYTRVVRAGKFLGSTISDLEGYVEQQPDASTLQVLGDAYMKDGRLQEALDVYRQALGIL